MITQQDLVTEFGETEIRRVSDHERTGEINADVVAKAIKSAENDALSYLNGAGLTRAMLTPPPDVLKEKIQDIARWKLWEDGTNKEVQKRYDLAIEWLKRVQTNPKMLGVEFNNKESDTANGIVSGVDACPNPKPNWKF